jgi:hypothetical protein
MLLMLLPGPQYLAKTDVFYVYNPGFCLVFGVPLHTANPGPFAGRP